MAIGIISHCGLSRCSLSIHEFVTVAQRLRRINTVEGEYVVRALSAGYLHH